MAGANKPADVADLKPVTENGAADFGKLDGKDLSDALVGNMYVTCDLTNGDRYDKTEQALILNTVVDQLMLDNITDLNNQYGVDAILLVAIHKWMEPEVNEVVVFAEFTLRSVKSGLELMHTWVRGDKLQPVDDKGDPIELAADLAFIKTTEMKPRLAHRCLLLQGMSDFALRNMPTSASRWMFKQDQYTSANPNFYSFLMNTDGSIEREKYNEDAFGNECFTD
jgi:hypothetical protein